jgi:hypothetical protein
VQWPGSVCIRCEAKIPKSALGSKQSLYLEGGRGGFACEYDTHSLTLMQGKFMD